ncbi:MAG: 50S ribosomal protein L20 [Candidatus Kerfeldbacteria bacterium]|nr:50S ribosomal protein L20 [Candidatus Kerfeldbacteria bacterium]
MARVKRGSSHTKHRSGILKQAKGYYAGRKNLIRQAKNAVRKSGQRAYDHRKQKKRTRRALWQVKINAAARAAGINYSTFMNALTKKNILVDRKILATLAEHHPALFDKIVAEVKKK